MCSLSEQEPSNASQPERSKRANASGASESSRMRAVVYLKLGTRQTKNCTYHRLKVVHKSTSLFR